MEPKILQYCNIKDGKVFLNGKEIFVATEKSDVQLTMKEIYKYFEINYPKFYKMDSLCKLSILCSSLILDNYPKEIDTDMGLILSNKSSCLDIDLIHQSTISENNGDYVSPANFVYTLPNIALGEISIKYKLKSENSFFVFKEFNPQFLVDYSKFLIKFGISKSVLGGWVEIHQQEYNAFMFIVGEGEGLDFDSKNLLKLI